MYNEKVSIIIPVYNIARWIGECIASLVKQSYTNLEILLVDDGSPDNSGSICDDWAKKDSRIRVIHKPNGGAASARNVGMDQATGSLWCFIDGDDIVDPHFVEHLYKSMVDNETDMAACGFIYWSKNKKRERLCESAAGKYLREEYLLQFLKDWTCSPLTNKLFRKEIIGDIRMEKGHRIDDEFFTYQVVMNCRSVVVIDECLYYYRLRSSSVMQELDSAKEKVMLDRVEYLTTRYQKIAAHIPEIEETFFVDTWDTMLRYWYHSKNMPTAQRQIRQWAKKHRKRMFHMPLPYKKKMGYLISMFFTSPKVCAEELPIQENEGDLFE